MIFWFYSLMVTVSSYKSVYSDQVLISNGIFPVLDTKNYKSDASFELKDQPGLILTKDAAKEMSDFVAHGSFEKSYYTEN